MQVVGSKDEVRRICRESARPLGLVPTMGALHQGHLSLVDRAHDECETVAVSIFVNPTQFGEGEDFALYPRDLDADLELLRQRGVDLVFVPDVAEVYPPGFDTWVDVGPIADRLEGAARPGHFRGVATVVAKLFGIVQPQRAYFGQKDGQQTVVVRKLARDLDMGINDRGAAHCTRSRRAGNEQPERAPHPRTAAGGSGGLPCSVSGSGVMEKW